MFDISAGNIKKKHMKIAARQQFESTQTLMQFGFSALMSIDVHSFVCVCVGVKMIKGQRKFRPKNGLPAKKNMLDYYLHLKIMVDFGLFNI